MLNLNEIYKIAYSDEMEKLSSRLIGRGAPYPPEVERMLNERKMRESEKKHRSGAGEGASPAEERRFNVLRRRGMTHRSSV